jgi:type I restriction enzyme S subunit
LADLAAQVPRAITDGPFGSNLKTEHYTDTGPRVIRLQNIGDAAFLDARAHISDEHFQLLRAHEARGGDIVVASLGDELPRAALVPDALGPAIVKADCPRIRPGDVNAQYLMYALNSPPVREQATYAIHGVGRQRLKLASLKKLLIPVAPRNEQDGIVAVLDAHLARAAQARSHFAQALDRLTDYREAVLGATLGGQLSTLTESTSQSLAAAPRVALGELATIQSGFRTKTSSDAGGPKILRITDIQGGAVDWTGVPRCVDSPDEPENYALRPGDLVFARIGFTTGKSCLITDDVPDGAVYASYLVRVRFKDPVDPDFVALFFQSSIYWEYVRAQRRGIDRPTLNGKVLARLPVPVPPMSAQRDAVEHARRHLAAVEALRTRVVTQSARVDALRRSLLATAFTGGLDVRSSAYGIQIEAPVSNDARPVLAGG